VIISQFIARGDEKQEDHRQIEPSTKLIESIEEK
jgi:hypothetical protein